MRCSSSNLPWYIEIKVPYIQGIKVYGIPISYYIYIDTTYRWYIWSIMKLQNIQNHSTWSGLLLLLAMDSETPEEELLDLLTCHRSVSGLNRSHNGYIYNMKHPSSLLMSISLISFWKKHFIFHLHHRLRMLRAPSHGTPPVSVLQRNDITLEMPRLYVRGVLQPPWIKEPLASPNLLLTRCLLGAHPSQPTWWPCLASKICFRKRMPWAALTSSCPHKNLFQGQLQGLSFATPLGLWRGFSANMIQWYSQLVSHTIVFSDGPTQCLAMRPVWTNSATCVSCICAKSYLLHLCWKLPW